MIDMITVLLNICLLIIVFLLMLAIIIVAIIVIIECIDYLLELIKEHKK